MIKIKLTNGKSADVVISKISLFRIDEGSYDGLPDNLYFILIDGVSYRIESAGEFERIKTIVSNYINKIS